MALTIQTALMKIMTYVTTEEGKFCLKNLRNRYILNLIFNRGEEFHRKSKLYISGAIVDNVFVLLNSKEGFGEGYVNVITLIAKEDQVTSFNAFLNIPEL